MAGISNRHRRFRTLKQMASDVSFAPASHRSETLTYGGQWNVLNGVMWAWSEFDGKFNCSQWSVEAGKLRDANRNNHGLCHEHVIPRKFAMALLESLPDPTPEIVEAVLKAFC